jgi:hypothetical protein
LHVLFLKQVHHLTDRKNAPADLLLEQTLRRFPLYYDR